MHFGSRQLVQLMHVVAADQPKVSGACHYCDREQNTPRIGS